LLAATNVPIQLVPGPLGQLHPSSVLLPSGELVVVYVGLAGIMAKRGTPSALATAPEFAVATTTLIDRQPFAILSGDFVIFFLLHATTAATDTGPGTLQYRRWRHTNTNNPFDMAAQQLSAANTIQYDGSFSA